MRTSQRQYFRVKVFAIVCIWTTKLVAGGAHGLCCNGSIAMQVSVAPSDSYLTSDVTSRHPVFFCETAPLRVTDMTKWRERFRRTHSFSGRYCLLSVWTARFPRFVSSNSKKIRCQAGEWVYKWKHAMWNQRISNSWDYFGMIFNT